ncbi:MAG: ATP-binding protein [Chloroflexota bacterium]
MVGERIGLDSGVRPADTLAGRRGSSAQTVEPTERRLQRSQALAAVARELASLAAPAEWGARAVAAVESATGWQEIFLFRLNEPSRALELVAARGVPPERERRSARMSLDGVSLSATAARRATPIVSGATDLPPAVAANARRQGFVAFAVLPLIARGRTLGTLTLLDTERRTVDAGHLAFLQAVADQLAIGLQNAHLYATAESARMWLQTIFDQMTDGILVLDPQGRVLESNAAAARLFGGQVPAGATAAERRDRFDLRHPDGTVLLAAESPSAQALARGERITDVGIVVARPDGSQLELSVNAAPLRDDAGCLIGAVTVWRDVTEVRRFERAKDNFLSVASHELRTPLTPLKGLTQIMLRRLRGAPPAGAVADPSRMERYLETMLGQIDRLTGVVNDLLDISRIKTGRVQLRPEPVDLIALVRSVLEQFETQALAQLSAGTTSGAGGESSGSVENDEPRRHRITLRLGAAAIVGRWDPARLEQVITNLVANSLKYSPAGSEVVITVQEREGDAGTEAHLSVADQGIGIPAAQMADLFRPFVRLTNAPAETFGGLGLGLYIAHDITQRHGGRIWAESRGPGQGATFHVALPLAT